MKLIKLSVMTAAVLAANLLACGSDGAPGAPGAPGTPGAPGDKTAGEDSSLSLVTPNKGVLDREVEVSIGGSGTTFEEGQKPEFGPGIEVLEVTKSTKTLINARIKIAANAPVGPRKVVIGTLEAENAFSVIPAVSVKGTTKVGQGDFLELELENNDTKAFDPAAFGVMGNGFLDLGSSASGPQTATAFLLAAPLAKAGKTQLTIANLGADGKPKLSFLSAPDAVEVTTRTPAAFTLEEATEQTFGKGTKLFKLSTPANTAAIVDYRIEVGEEGTAVPLAFVFGTSGQVEDEVGFVMPQQGIFGGFNPPPYDLHVTLPLAATSAAVDHYVVLADLSGTSGAKATVTASRATATTTVESATAHGVDAPQVLEAITAESARLVTGELKADAEVDAYKLTVPAGEKTQVTVTGDADLRVILTKDPAVLSDPSNTPAASRKVVGSLAAAKGRSSQSVVANPGVTEIYAVVVAHPDGTTKTGKYTLGARKAK